MVHLEKSGLHGPWTIYRSINFQLGSSKIYGKWFMEAWSILKWFLTHRMIQLIFYRCCFHLHFLELLELLLRLMSVKCVLLLAAGWITDYLIQSPNFECSDLSFLKKTVKTVNFSLKIEIFDKNDRKIDQILPKFLFFSLINLWKWSKIK